MTAKPPIGAILASAMLSLFLVSGSGYGQSLKDTAYSNTVKINLAAGYFRNVSPEFTIDFRFNNFRYGIGIGYIF